MSENPRLYKFVSVFVVVYIWTFPYVIGAIPILMFFNGDRTQWLKDNGFTGIDWNENGQQTLQYCLITVIFMLFFYIVFIVCK